MEGDELVTELSGVCQTQAVWLWAQEMLMQEWDGGQGKHGVPENGREVWGQGSRERFRWGRKIWQQGELRLGQALLKMAFVTWQQQPQMPFLFSFFHGITSNKQN